MPGSWTTPGRAGARAIAPVRVAFRAFEHVGTQVAQVFAAQWLAYVLPYRRFADTLASANARLRAGADRYSFTVVDFHLLLLAGLPGAPEILNFDTPRAAYPIVAIQKNREAAGYAGPPCCTDRPVGVGSWAV